MSSSFDLLAQAIYQNLMMCKAWHSINWNDMLLLNCKEKLEKFCGVSSMQLCFLSCFFSSSPNEAYPLFAP